MLDTLVKIADITTPIIALIGVGVAVWGAYLVHQWSKKLRQGNPIEGRCCLSICFPKSMVKGAMEDVKHLTYLPCSLIPAIDIDKTTETVMRAKIFVETFRKRYPKLPLELPNDYLWFDSSEGPPPYPKDSAWLDIHYFHVWYKGTWRKLEVYNSQDS